MTLRGTCIGLQKTFILPGRHVYEYPITPDLFPWFYDKKLWTEYLDFLAANRMNTLYLWSGHPFASLVRLKDYPYAVEVPDDVFQQNQEMYRWLAQECDKRGIWLVQMFYNILVSKPFAETNHISTQLSAPTPLVSDYTRKSIAEFVKEYPNVGLLVCLGEALRGTPNQLEWCTNVILPGVLDGMKAAGLKEAAAGRHPHARDGSVRDHARGVQVYSNLFTMTKYNGESLTTWEPRGKDQATHLAMAKLGPHIVNVHILSNLEPFRYGDTEFIKKSVQASRDRLGASGHSSVSAVVLELAVFAGHRRAAAVAMAARLDLVRGVGALCVESRRAGKGRSRLLDFAARGFLRQHQCGGENSRCL